MPVEIFTKHQNLPAIGCMAGPPYAGGHDLLRAALVWVSEKVAPASRSQSLFWIKVDYDFLFIVLPGYVRLCCI